MVSRAKEILKTIDEGGKTVKSRTAEKHGQEDDGQLSLLAQGDNEVVSRLKNLDINTLTPIESMQILYELAKLAGAY